MADIDNINFDLVSKTQTQVRQLLKTQPVVSYKLSGEVPFVLERFVCSQISASVPAFQSIVIGIQFSGAEIKVSNEHGNIHRSSSSLITFFPMQVATQYELQGEVDFALLFIPPQANAITKELFVKMQQLLSQVIVADAVLDSLLRQVLVVCNQLKIDAQQNISHTDQNYINAMMRALVAQVNYLLSAQKLVAFDSNSLQLNRVRRSIEYIQSHLGDDLKIDTLASLIDVSESYFRRIFNQITGQSVRQFILQTRLNRARELLLHSSLSISHLADSLGFSSQSHLTTAFAKQFNITPAQFRKRMRS